MLHECSQESLEAFSKWMGNKMAPQIDPMSAEAQDLMEQYQTDIVAHALQVLFERKQTLRQLNDSRLED
jgi:hypothetical protein